MSRRKGKGWILLYRSIQDNDIWNSNEPFDRRSAWIDLLLLMNHETRNVMIDGKLITVERGQHWTSTVKLANRWNWSRGRVKRYLDQLSGQGMIHVSSTARGTTITVIKYDVYQSMRTTNDTSDGTTGGTTDGTTDGTQTNNYRNNYRKNERKKGASAQTDPEYEEDYYQ